MTILSYAMDVTGQNSANKIVDEIHTLTSVNAAPYRILIPKFAPFYLNNFKLSHDNGSGVITPLVEDVDYYLCLPYLGATRSIGSMIYGAVTINDSLVNGTIKITYQTLGGEWIVDTDQVLARLAETIYNPRLTVWDAVSGTPEAFPPINHDHHMDFIYGHKDLIDAIHEVVNAILNKQSQSPTTSIIKHLTDTDNPHETTKAHVGLSDVANLPLATDQEVLAYADVNKYITLRQLWLLITPPARDAVISKPVITI